MACAQTHTYFDEKAPMVALRSLFEKYDTDNNGRLDKHELWTLLREDLGMTKEQAETYRYYLDTDADNTISFTEFETWFHSEEKFRNINDECRYHFLRRAIEMFKKYDTDKNLAIDANEFHLLYEESGGIGMHEQEALRCLDVDHNGLISFQEFLRWLNWVPLDGMSTNEHEHWTDMQVGISTSPLTHQSILL